MLPGTSSTTAVESKACLEMLCGRTRVVELTTRKAITAEDLAGFDLHVKTCGCS
jgi:hypothetical protein